MLILAIRPEPGASRTVEAGRGMGLVITASPLFEVVPVAWDAPDPADVDAILIGSANAIRHSGAQLRAFSHLPVHAVGRSTAQAAEAAGLRVERVGQGGLQAIVDAATDPVRYLRLAGREHVDLVLPPLVSMVERVCYETISRALPVDVAARLQQAQEDEGTIVLLHSAVAAAHWRRQCETLGLAKCAIRIAALGPRIGDAAGEGWQELRCAPQPTDEALLALVADMCH